MARVAQSTAVTARDDSTVVGPTRSATMSAAISPVPPMRTARPIVLTAVAAAWAASWSEVSARSSERQRRNMNSP